MAKLPRVSGLAMVGCLQTEGLTLVRVRGSHHFVEAAATGRRTTVPVYGNRDLRTGALRSILRDADLTVAEFERRFHA